MIQLDFNIFKLSSWGKWGGGGWGEKVFLIDASVLTK